MFGINRLTKLFARTAAPARKTQPRARPAVEALEERWNPGTFTLVNSSTQTVYVELIRHMPATTSHLGYMEDAGSYTVAPGTARDFDSGDQGVLVRTQGPGGAYTMRGPGISYAGKQLATLQTGYDFTVGDGSRYAQVSIGGTNYGLRTVADLAGSFGRAHGVSLVDGFYSFPNDYTAVVHGPRAVTGSLTIPFNDHCGSTDSKWIDHVYSPPHGARVVSYRVNLSSNRGDNMHFVLQPGGGWVHQYGSISGGGLFQYGGSYVGTITIQYEY
jgi:hypothetical protein